MQCTLLFFLKIGLEAVDMGCLMYAPVGAPALGRIFNMIGEPVDNQGDVSNDETLPIHRDAPVLSELEAKPSIFETGVKAT